MAFTHFIAKKLINYDSEKSLAFRLRKKRARRIKELIVECYNKNGKVDIIDIGGTKTYWNIISKDFLTRNKVHITVINIPSQNPLPADDDIFNFHSGNGCSLTQFADDSFHIAHSNSVIEHVGNESNRIMFASEIKRVAKVYYVQTPNYWFPIEPHFITPFFHWLPEQIRIKLILHFDLGWFKKANNYKEAKEKIDSCNLLTKSELKCLFPETCIYSERIFFLIKSFVLINNKLASSKSSTTQYSKIQ